MRYKSTKRIALCGVLVALSFVLANVKIMGSIAFDSMPAFLGGLLMGPLCGAAVACFGHLSSAALAGFPFTLPLHIAISVFMAAAAATLAVVFKRIQNRFLAPITATAVGLCLNGPLPVLALRGVLSRFLGEGGLIPFALVLCLASLANIVLAFLVYAFVRKVYKNE